MSIRVEGLEKRFGERVAVTGLSFEVKPGEVFGLMVTTPARAWPDMRTLDERSNVVLVRWGS